MYYDSQLKTSGQKLYQFESIDSQDI